MADCPLADECPRFSERIEGMGCRHYGDRSGAEWCSSYNMPIEELKQQPVKIGEELVVEVTDIHESGSGVGRTEDGFIILVEGTLPEARARVKITKVHSNHAKAEELERLPMGDDEETEGTEESEAADDTEEGGDEGPTRPERLGSRDNFWGS